MIISVTYLALKCDNCGALYDNGGCDDYSLLTSAERKGWYLGFKHYCPKCRKKKKGGKK